MTLYQIQGPNFIPSKLCLHSCRWDLLRPHSTSFTETYVQVKNKCSTFKI